ncbi:unnamed protein product, partial [Pelagomonas calceolata]
GKSSHVLAILDARAAYDCLQNKCAVERHLQNKYAVERYVAGSERYVAGQPRQLDKRQLPAAGGYPRVLPRAAQ